jgi:hypothetical protein
VVIIRSIVETCSVLETLLDPANKALVWVLRKVVSGVVKNADDVTSSEKTEQAKK